MHVSDTLHLNLGNNEVLYKYIAKLIMLIDQLVYSFKVAPSNLIGKGTTLH